MGTKLTISRTFGVIASLLWVLQCAAQQAEPQQPNQGTNAPLTAQTLAGLKNQEPFQTFPVASTNGDVVGQLSNTIFDWNTREAKFGVILLFEQVNPDHGYTVVPFELLKYSPSTKQIIVQTSTGKLRQAPTIKPNNLPASVEGDWGKEYYAFYGVNPRGTSSSASSSVGSGGMVPSGTIKGSGANTPTPEDPIGRGALFFLGASLAVSLLVIIMLVRARRRETA